MTQVITTRSVLKYSFIIYQFDRYICFYFILYNWLNLKSLAKEKARRTFIHRLGEHVIQNY
jgi:hypothetical protein